MSIFHKDPKKKKAPLSDTRIFDPATAEPKPEDSFEAPDIPEEEEYTDLGLYADEEERLSSSEQDDRQGKMEEIYSTRDKHIKYKRLTPIEAEAAARRMSEAKEALIQGKSELSLENSAAYPEVELEAELDADTIVADEIIEDVREMGKLRNIYVQDIDDIDVSLDAHDALRQYEKRANDTERHDQRAGHFAPAYIPSAEKIVAKVPVYRREQEADKIHLKAGRFTEVVESEYDEYLKSNDPTISKNFHAMNRDTKPTKSLLYTLSQMATRKKEEEQKKKPTAPPVKKENFDEDQQPIIKKKKKSKAGRFFKVLGTLFVSSFVSKANKEDEPVDYDSREDERYVLEKIDKSVKRLSMLTLWYTLIAIVLLVLSILERVNGAGVFVKEFAGGGIIYCALNVVLLIVLGVIGRSSIISGVTGLRRFRGNVDTASALAYLACLLQGLVALFTNRSFAGGDAHLYGFIVALAFLFNTVGRLLTELRVRSNFRFITSRSPAYAAKIYNDEESARRMVSGTTASKGVVAYQHITRFLSDFLKISYAPDPSEEIASRINPITIVSSLFVTVAYAIIFKNVQGTVSALSVMLCISIPFTALLTGSIPMLLFSKRMLKYNAMVAGYPSVRQFCDTTAVSASAAELFPRDSITIDEMNTYQDFRVDDGLLSAAMVLREAKSPLEQVFEELIQENLNTLPSVESVMFEEKCGVVGWVGGERILIGNMNLMNRYHITVPDEANEERVHQAGKQITYIAVAGRLLAAIVLTYRPNPFLSEQLTRAEQAGLCIVVASTDPNVTAELIAEEYRLFYRSVKVLPIGYANEIDEVTSKVEDTSRAYLATRGRFSSLLRSVAGCIGLRSNMTMGIIIEMFGLILGVLLCATLVLYASVARLSFVELIIYIGFWSAATVLAQLIRRP